MWHIQRIDSPLLSSYKLIAFVGSGGKTTLMEFCARSLVKKGKSVAITTTTKIFATKPFFLFENVYEKHCHRDFVRIGKNLSEKKLTGLSFDEIEKLCEVYDVVLVEADGAKGKPLKFPSQHEPVIPPFSEMTYVLCGLDGISGRVDKMVFRWELLKNVTGIDGSANINKQEFLRFFSYDILLKGVDIKRSTIILNKYDVLHNRASAVELAKMIIQKTGIGGVVVASTLFNIFYLVRRT